HAVWNAGWIVQESSQKPHCAELNAKAQPHVGPASARDEALVGVIEMKIAREFLGRQFAIELAVAARLLFSQKADGHGKVMQKILVLYQLTINYSFRPGDKGSWKSLQIGDFCGLVSEGFLARREIEKIALYARVSTH